MGKSLPKDVAIEDKNVKLAVETYMPLAFGAVNTACSKFEKTEGKNVYDTEVVSGDERVVQVHAGKEACTTGAECAQVAKWRREACEGCGGCGGARGEFESHAGVRGGKREVSAGIAETVSKEKEVVEQENAKAVVEAQKVAAIQTEVAAQQASCAKDLEQAEPALMRAMAA